MRSFRWLCALAAIAGAAIGAGPSDWQATLAERRQWWAFQPAKAGEPPIAGKSQHPIDRFIDARLAQTKLEPAPRADRAALIRRLSFALTGLPPAADRVAQFVQDESAEAWGKLVDEMLASPQFGERWARHWMDWVRYADTHGSEGDPPIPNAWQYRDYLIRAFNADVPYDQLVREAIAGDLLAEPRLNAAMGLNESAIGPAQFRFVQHGYKPVDPLDEMERFTENQIDVVGKAFNALTIACARCHDHKFDPVSMRDYYAMAGIFTSSHPGQVMTDAPQELARNVRELEQAKKQIRTAIADVWSRSLSDLPQRLSQWAAGKPKALEHQLLYPYFAVCSNPNPTIAGRWVQVEKELKDEKTKRTEQFKKLAIQQWTPADPGDLKFFALGQAATARPSGGGEFTVETTGPRAIGAVYPAGYFSHRLSTRHGAVYQSSSFTVTTDSMSVRLAGEGGGQARLVVENYPIPGGGIYNQLALPKSLQPGWFTWDLTFWKGYQAHLEIATYDDLTHVNKKADKDSKPEQDGRSAIGLMQVVFHNDGKNNPPQTVFANDLLYGIAVSAAIGKNEDLAALYRTLLMPIIHKWKQGGELDERQAMALNEMMTAGLLPNDLTALESVRLAVESYRKLEGEIPIARRVPGVLETQGADHPILARGDHKHPGDPTPRRYLEVLGSKSYATAQSGRLQLAEDLASPTNPLTTRVIVNRLWHHLFGKGLVATVDNFGRMGEQPTHPELLDWLADRMVREGWSIKRMIRLMVTSETWQRSVVASPLAAETDADNRLWSHMSIRRLEAEAIRDQLLSVAGRLDATMYGPTVDANGPPSKQTRRSIYMVIRRNAPSQFLETFDLPKPFTTIGRRDVTNVPAQSLTLLNDPLVIDAAKNWAIQLIKSDSSSSPAGRINNMYTLALSRSATPVETARTIDYLRALAVERNVADSAVMREVILWQDVAQSLFNIKEFIYLR